MKKPGRGGRLGPPLPTLAELLDSLDKVAGPVFGVSDPKELATLLPDPDRLDAALREVSAKTLLQLRHLVWRDGSASLEDLEKVDWPWPDDVGVTPDLLELARCGVLEVSYSYAGSKTSVHRWAMLADVSDALETRLYGLGLPEKPEPAPSPPLGHRQRLAIAVVGRLAQQSVRVTKRGTANRVDLKRFAKNAPLPDLAALDRLLDDLRRWGWIAPRRGALEPVLERVGERPGAEGISLRLREAVGAHGPLSRDALVRALVHHAHRHFETWTAVVRYPTQDAGDWAADCLDRLEGVVEVDGWYHPPGPAVDGDGFVTAAFDVIVGPGASAEVLREVAVASVLTGVDRMLTFRLEPESVLAAARFGRRLDGLLAALDRVSSAPLPDNVVGTVRDWWARYSFTTASRVWLLEGDDARLAQALGEEARVGPGRFAVRGPLEDVAEGLAAAGAPIGRMPRELAGPFDDGHIDLEDDHDDWYDDEVDDVDVPSLRPPAWHGGGGGALDERLRAARAGEVAWHWSEMRERPPERATTQSAATDLDEAPAGEDLPPEVRKLLREVVSHARQDLARLRRRLPRREQQHLDAAIAHDPTALIPFVSLKSKWRRRVLKQSRSIEEALDRATGAFGPSRLTPAGERLLAALSISMEDPSRELLEELAESGEQAGFILDLEGEPITAVVTKLIDGPDGLRVLLEPEDDLHGLSVWMQDIVAIVRRRGPGGSP